jgi:hypothetical protein
MSGVILLGRPAMTAVTFLCCCEMKDPNNGEVNDVDISKVGFDFADFLPPCLSAQCPGRVSAASPPSAELNVALLRAGRMIYSPE